MSDWAADLLAFLNARLDEDEAAAKAATPGPWFALTRAEVQRIRAKGEDGPEETWTAAVGGVPVMSDDESRSDADRIHVALHDPARVLREVGVKRNLIAEYEDCHNTGNSPEHYDGYWDAILGFAAVCSDHPDYQQEWPT